MSNNDEVEAILDAAQIHVEESKKELVTTDAIVVDATKTEKDFEYARTNLYALIEKGQDAMEDLSRFARESGHPRAYEVLGGLIKNLTDANKQLIDLHKQVQEVEKGGSKGSSGPRTVNNTIVFQGTNAQLSEAVREITGEKK
jgi:hypothetical protein